MQKNIDNNRQTQTYSEIMSSRFILTSLVKAKCHAVFLRNQCWITSSAINKVLDRSVKHGSSAAVAMLPYTGKPGQLANSKILWLSLKMPHSFKMISICGIWRKEHECAESRMFGPLMVHLTWSPGQSTHRTLRLVCTYCNIVIIAANRDPLCPAARHQEAV